MLDEKIQDTINYFNSMGPWTEKTTVAEVMPLLLTFVNKAIPALKNAQKQLIDQQFTIHELRAIRDDKIKIGAGMIGAQHSLVEKLKSQLEVALRSLEYYDEDPAFKESTYVAISSNFRSNNSASMAKSKINEIEKAWQQSVEM